MTNYLQIIIENQEKKTSHSREIWNEIVQNRDKQCKFKIIMNP